MSLSSFRDNWAYELAPHQLTNQLYNTQGSTTPFILPPSSVPPVFDSPVYPAVDGQFLTYYNTPRGFSGVSGSLGVAGGYRQTMSFDEGNSPYVGIQTLGPMLNYNNNNNSQSGIDYYANNVKLW